MRYRKRTRLRTAFFATRRFSGLTPYEFFGTAFWIGFVLHLIAAEVWIQWTRPQMIGRLLEHGYQR